MTSRNKGVHSRNCIKCHRTFTGSNRLCQECRATNRICESCSKPFKGNTLQCWTCRKIQRACLKCGRSYLGNHTLCPTCTKPMRTQTCEICGKSFRTNSSTVCRSCDVKTRDCVECGRQFISVATSARCWQCLAETRECIKCGRTVLMGPSQKCCQSCYRRENPLIMLALDSKHQNERRALKYATRISSPVSARTYREILNSGPCIYCGGTANTVDHITPLARGGHEIETNLVPACTGCNSSKRDCFLSEWRTDRVTHALAISPLVRAEYARQQAGVYR
jgi:HNH endonuclease